MDTRDRLLKVSAKLFAEQGFHSTSIREIANKSGLNSSLISYYFRSKDGLLEEILKVHTDKLVKAIKEPEIQSLSPNKRLLAIVELINKVQSEEIAYIVARALLNKKEKGTYRIIYECFVKDIIPIIKDLIYQCKLNPRHLDFMNHERLGLVLFTSTKLWLLYSDIILDTSEKIKTREQLEKEVSVMTQNTIKEFLSDD